MDRGGGRYCGGTEGGVNLANLGGSLEAVVRGWCGRAGRGVGEKKGRGLEEVWVVGRGEGRGSGGGGGSVPGR